MAASKSQVCGKDACGKTTVRQARLRQARLRQASPGSIAVSHHDVGEPPDEKHPHEAVDEGAADACADDGGTGDKVLLERAGEGRRGRVAGRGEGGGRRAAGSEVRGERGESGSETKRGEVRERCEGGRGSVRQSSASVCAPQTSHSMCGADATKERISSSSLRVMRPSTLAPIAPKAVTTVEKVSSACWGSGRQ